ncbi:MAG: thiamine biosynthesis protein [Candidatus Nephthysia bennettiae]|uniref:FAD:protein FMN transferase n=1 Tax=Candidatus Nephthysia bennettiae TaxID=3127016 RepID=A0A934N8E0_9BACT|nr:FAD:protein FMN transferase [Candidatus Dormibacteraeota bacterium]MBJ7612057.1 FAD:protein FMN transferase [Candidatus Dormibacteraeota bacterium]PZR99529.1 MAG: thiamine biosynthesis protein [Candidatus Dormibacteraeota bacterium]
MTPRVAEWTALGTEVVLAVSDPARLDQARGAVESVLRDVDMACSRFRDDSELALVNSAGGRWVAVGPLLVRALAAALWAARATGGAVDPTVGRALRVSGYDRDFKALRQDSRVRIEVTAVPGWKAIELDAGEQGRVRVPAGVELDLGATAKALAADRAATAASLAAGGCGVLVSLGGDVAVVGRPPPGGWLVQVSEPDGAEAQLVTIFDGGLATSSTRVRRWTRGGIRWHHILDPATGRPADGPWRLASVAAASCLEANTAATASIVLGDAAPDWLVARRCPARLVSEDGEVLALAGWPAC